MSWKSWTEMGLKATALLFECSDCREVEKPAIC